MTSRDEQYAEIVGLRKTCRRCVELANPSVVAQGRFDSEHIGPWSRWQGNLDARLMVVGQDWGDSGYFERHQGWDREIDSPTNRRLRELLASIDVLVPSADLSPDPQVAFFTNAVLCLKPEETGMQGPTKSAWFANCRSYLRAQIELIRPSVVVGLGKPAFESVLLAFGKAPPRLMSEAITDDVGTQLFNGTRAFAVYHCGNLGLTHRPLDKQRLDWQRIGRALSKGDR